MLSKSSADSQNFLCGVLVVGMILTWVDLFDFTETSPFIFSLMGYIFFFSYMVFEKKSVTWYIFFIFLLSLIFVNFVFSPHQSRSIQAFKYLVFYFNIFSVFYLVKFSCEKFIRLAIWFWCGCLFLQIFLDLLGIFDPISLLVSRYDPSKPSGLSPEGAYFCQMLGALYLLFLGSRGQNGLRKISYTDWIVGMSFLMTFTATGLVLVILQAVSWIGVLRLWRTLAVAIVIGYCTILFSPHLLELLLDLDQSGATRIVLNIVAIDRSNLILSGFGGFEALVEQSGKMSSVAGPYLNGILGAPGTVSAPALIFNVFGDFGLVIGSLIVWGCLFKVWFQTLKRKKGSDRFRSFGIPLSLYLLFYGSPMTSPATAVAAVFLLARYDVSESRS